MNKLQQNSSILSLIIIILLILVQLDLFGMDLSNFSLRGIKVGMTLKEVQLIVANSKNRKIRLREITELKGLRHYDYVFEDFGINSGSFSAYISCHGYVDSMTYRVQFEEFRNDPQALYNKALDSLPDLGVPTEIDKSEKLIYAQWGEISFEQFGTNSLSIIAYYDGRLYITRMNEKLKENCEDIIQERNKKIIEQQQNEIKKRKIEIQRSIKLEL